MKTLPHTCLGKKVEDYYLDRHPYRVREALTCILYLEQFAKNADLRTSKQLPVSDLFQTQTRSCEFREFVTWDAYLSHLAGVVADPKVDAGFRDQCANFHEYGSELWLKHQSRWLCTGGLVHFQVLAGGETPAPPKELRGYFGRKDALGEIRATFTGAQSVQIHWTDTRHTETKAEIRATMLEQSPMSHPVISRE